MSPHPKLTTPPETQRSRRRSATLLAPLAIAAAVFAPTITDSVAQAAEAPFNGLFTVVNKCNDEVLDIEYVSTLDGAPALTWARNEGQNQQWNVRNLGQGNISLVALHSAKALGVIDSKAAQVASTNISWIVRNVGGDWWSLSPSSSLNSRLTMPASGEQLILAAPAAGCSQQWKFELLSPNDVPTSPPTTEPTTTIVAPTTAAPTTAAPTTAAPTTAAPTTAAPTTHNHGGGGGNAVLPAPAVGLSYPGTIPEATPIKRPSGDTTGNFRVVCQFSHMNYDDPIVHPGKPGAAHLHTYFGNVGAKFNSTGASLLASGNSTCDGGTLNRSSYWVPTMMAADGKPIAPDSNMIYYKSGYQGIEPQNVVQSLPNGLKLIAGNPAALNAEQNSQVAWSCSTLSFRGRQGTIPSCPEGETLKAEIQFPQCWNGRDLSSPDLVSHMAYGQWSVGCPSTHPIGIPSISFNVTWPVPAGGTEGWHISSDKTPAADGASLHGDVILAWDPATATTWLNNCVRQNADCNVGQITDTSRLISGQRQ
jgi:Domain of unknown function (DUF1996)/Ricin-type beta-trefoil lectin domain-like